MMEGEKNSLKVVFGLQQGEKLFDKLSTVVKTKSAIMKEKLATYIKNEQPVGDRCVSSLGPTQVRTVK